jgi:hypothetical protein
MKVILPRHLKDKPKEHILEFLDNKLKYHYGMIEMYRIARQKVESGKDFFFEDDPEFDELFPTKDKQETKLKKIVSQHNKQPI